MMNYAVDIVTFGTGVSASAGALSAFFGSSGRYRNLRPIRYVRVHKEFG